MVLSNEDLLLPEGPRMTFNSPTWNSAEAVLSTFRVFSEHGGAGSTMELNIGMRGSEMEDMLRQLSWGDNSLLSECGNAATTTEQLET
jgi:hypothetical protein